MPVMIKCPNCAAPIERNSTLCPYCEVALYAEGDASSGGVPRELVSSAQWAALPAALKDIASGFNEMVTTAPWADLHAAGHGRALDELVKDVLAIGARVKALPKYVAIEADDALDLLSQIVDFLHQAELWTINLASDLVAWASAQLPDNLFLMGSCESSTPLRDRLHKPREFKAIAKAAPPTSELANLRAAVPSVSRP
jgi:hypothetical protein